MERRTTIHEGKAKIIYAGTEPGTCIHHFKDDATAFNNAKRGTIRGKGSINNRISANLMEQLGAVGIPTHFVRRLNMREQLVHQVDIIPVEVVVRNVAAGSLCQRLGLKEGERLPRPLVEYYYKNDDLGDPLVSEDHIIVFQWASNADIEEIYALAIRINDILYGFFQGVGLILVDFKLEFGRLWQEDQPHIVLADEISPDTCRLWDSTTRDKLDKDRFRNNLGNVEEAYREVARRLGVLPNPAATASDSPAGKPMRPNATRPATGKPAAKKS